MRVFIMLFDLFSGCDIQMLSACTSSLSIIFLGIASGIGGYRSGNRKQRVSWDVRLSL